MAAANRDEFHARPSSPPRLRHIRTPGNAVGDGDGDGVDAHDDLVGTTTVTDTAATTTRRVLAPRDERAGGTWLGLSESGLFAALTNRPSAAPDPARRSRGHLVTDALAAHTRADAAALAFSALPAAHYNPFNLLVADARDAFVIAYEETPRVCKLAPGAHVIGNAEPDARAHPKCGRLLEAAEKLATGARAAALPGLTALLRSHEGAGGDSRLRPCGPQQRDASSRAHEGGGARALDDTCIHMDDYGTRSSALLQLGAKAATAAADDDHAVNHNATLRRAGADATDARISQFWFADGAPCTRAYEDFSPQLAELLRSEA